MGKRRGGKGRSSRSSSIQSEIDEEVDLGDIDSFVSNKLVVESGRDTEGRPIFAFYAMRFPDPKDVDYDELLKYTDDLIFTTLEHCSENWMTMYGTTM